MTMRSMQPERSSGKRSRKPIPALCRFIGTFILIAVIAAFLPLTLPRAIGWEAYEVVSGSMEPELPVGSMILRRRRDRRRSGRAISSSFRKTGR